MFFEALLLIIILLLILTNNRKPPEMPPGSFGLPVLGNMPLPGVTLISYLRKFKQKYGNIFTVKWGGRVVVFLADPHVIRRAFNNVLVQNRPPILSFQMLNNYMNLGIIYANGLPWKNNRRFMIQHLKNLGMGKSYIETSIAEEVKMFVSYLENNSLNKPTEIDGSINIAILNATWQLLASKRYEADDHEIIQINRNTTESIAIIQGPIMIVDAFPWIQNIIPKFFLDKWTGRKVLIEHQEHFYKLSRKVIEEHEKSLDPDNPRDIIDHYLLEWLENKNNPESLYRDDHHDLLVIMRDMFAAGSETTSTTLRWLILLMATNQHIQKKAQEILDRVSQHQLPSLEHRSQLAYIDAIILDVLRLTSHTVIGAPHYTAEDAQLEGYTIPKDTIIMSCLEVCHKDPQLWEKPEILYPEHFLDEDGKLDSKKDGFLPFSVGRRQCFGESMARMNLFLFTAAILHMFTIEPPPGVRLSTLPDTRNIIFHYPRPFKIVLRKRNTEIY